MLLAVFSNLNNPMIILLRVEFPMQQLSSSSFEFPGKQTSTASLPKPRANSNVVFSHHSQRILS